LKQLHISSRENDRKQKEGQLPIKKLSICCVSLPLDCKLISIEGKYQKRPLMKIWRRVDYEIKLPFN
jgi:hypothetical protein